MKKNELVMLCEARGWDYTIDENGMIEFILGNQDFYFHESDTEKTNEILAEIKEWWS